MPCVRISLKQTVRVTSLEQFLGFFFNSKERIRIAEAIISNIPYKNSKWGSICVQGGFNSRTYREVLRILREEGLVEKRDSVVVLSGLVSGRLGKLAGYWGDFVKTKEKEEE